jgi:hypothetical protein
MGEADKAAAARKARNTDKAPPKPRGQQKKRRADEAEPATASPVLPVSTNGETRADHSKPAMMQRDGKDMQTLWDPKQQFSAGQAVSVTDSSGRPIRSIAEYHAFGDPVVIRLL